MKLKKFSIGFSVIVIFALMINAMLLLMIQKSNSSVITVQKHRQSAMTLAMELQRETEQLTLFVRDYTSTGEIRYLTYYYDILAIRNGEKPLPDNYTNLSSG